MCSVKTKNKKEKNLGTLIGIIMWSWSLLVSFSFSFFFFFLSQTCENLYKKGEAEMRWTAVVVLSHLQNRFFFFSMISYLGSYFPLTVSVSGSCSGSEPVRCISTGPLRRVLTPSLQVFGIGIPLLCFPLYSFCVLMFVHTGMQLRLHKHHSGHFKVPASWTPEVVLSRRLAVEAVAGFSFYFIFFLRKWLHGTSMNLPQHSWPPKETKPQTRSPSSDPVLLVFSSSPRGSPQCIAFKRYCTRQHLTAATA